jgi:hypothetical protein
MILLKKHRLHNEKRKKMNEKTKQSVFTSNSSKKNQNQRKNRVGENKRPRKQITVDAVINNTDNGQVL